MHGARRSIRSGRQSVATWTSGYDDSESPSTSLVTRTREGRGDETAQREPHVAERPHVNPGHVRLGLELEEPHARASEHGDPRGQAVGEGDELLPGGAIVRRE